MGDNIETDLREMVCSDPDYGGAEEHYFLS
jgi:hypothetical protein